MAERTRRDLDPRDQDPVRMLAETRTVATERRQLVRIDEAPGGEDRVEGHRTVALREQEAVASRVVGGWRGHREDPVVEHPDRVERRKRRWLVLLVAGHQGDERAQVVIAELAVRSDGVA